MDEQIDRLVSKTWEKFQNVPKDQRLMIAVSGIPGSGKTTLAAVVAKRLQDLHARQSSQTAQPEPIATFIPMDGYHLSRAQLDAMSDPATAHARRGAAFTFDGFSFLSLVQSLRSLITLSTTTLHAPSFDHAKKDPVEKDIAIPPSIRLIIFEGNYLSLNKSPWRDAAQLMDELWFVAVDFDVARKRLVRRHVRSGIAEDEESAGKRADENDLVNGTEILENRLDVQEVIQSREDEKWAPLEQEKGAV